MLHRLDILHISAATLMIFVWESLPMVEILEVGFHNGRCLNTLHSILHEIRMLVSNDDGIESSVLVIRTYGNNQEVNGLVVIRFESLEKVIPTKWE